MTQEEYDNFVDILDKFELYILSMVPAFIVSQNYGTTNHISRNGAKFIDTIESIDRRGVLVTGEERWHKGGYHRYSEFIPVEFIVNFKPTED